jgi:hypothetical protein
MYASQAIWWQYLTIYPFFPFDASFGIPLFAIFTALLFFVGSLNLLVKGASISLVLAIFILLPIIAAGSFGVILHLIPSKWGGELFNEEVKYSSWGSWYERTDHVWQYVWTAYLGVAIGAGMCWFFPQMGKSLIETVQQFVPK